MEVGDDEGSAGFSFSFGVDGQADLVAVITEMGSCVSPQATPYWKIDLRHRLL